VRHVTYHQHLSSRRPGADPVNAALTLHGDDPDQDMAGLPIHYLVAVGGMTLGHLYFQSKPVTDLASVDGLTDAVLLAILQDRLEHRQRGALAGPHARDALHHVKLALGCLFSAEAARPDAATKESAVAEEKCAVAVWNDMLVIAEDPVVPVRNLHTSWSAWSDLEAPLKAIKRPLTAHEWSVLAGLATTAAARNGLAELKSALARTQAP
jgi:hypothetical protein